MGGMNGHYALAWQNRCQFRQVGLGCQWLRSLLVSGEQGIGWLAATLPTLEFVLESKPTRRRSQIPADTKTCSSSLASSNSVIPDCNWLPQPAGPPLPACRSCPALERSSSDQLIAKSERMVAQYLPILVVCLAEDPISRSSADVNTEIGCSRGCYHPEKRIRGWDD
jgi:hypothetical protein